MKRIDATKNVGKFSNGGRNKFVPLWTERKANVQAAPKNVIVRKTWTFNINLFDVLAVGLIIYLLISIL